MAENSIDTDGLLTVLGIIAAIWAVIPSESRLRFRLSVTWLDWSVVIGVFLLVHYLMFAPALRAAGMYYSLGPWALGLDEKNAVYGILLALGGYLLIRARSPRLASRNIALFGTLVDNLLLTKRYDNLSTILAPQISKLIAIADSDPSWRRVADKVTPASSVRVDELYALITGQPIQQKKPKLRNQLRRGFLWLANHSSQAAAQQQARDILQNLASTQTFVGYIATAHPDLCLEIMKRPAVVRDDFIDYFFEALLADSSSRLYVEIKNNNNLNGDHRLALPPANRILCFFFKDVSIAARLGVYRAVGEFMLRTLKEDKRLVDQYNEPLGFYDDVGKFRCPISTGIKIFEIMVHEGIHQGEQDHLWLHYFPHFVEGILKAMRDQVLDDESHEFPTVFYYLLYQLVSICSNWMEDGLNVKIEQLPEKAKAIQDLDLFYISDEAAQALGSMTQDILLSPKTSETFKQYVLEVILRGYKKIESEPKAHKVAATFRNAVIKGMYISPPPDYLRTLWRTYKSVDHVLRADVDVFDEALKEELRAKGLLSGQP